MIKTALGVKRYNNRMDKIFRNAIESKKKYHKLIIYSLHDAQASCSCGKWSISCTGERSKEELENEFDKHFNGRC